MSDTRLLSGYKLTQTRPMGGYQGKGPRLPELQYSKCTLVMWQSPSTYRPGGVKSLWLNKVGGRCEPGLVLEL
jgi:hypothetical protein